MKARINNKIMKKIIFIALVVLMMVGCSEEMDRTTKGENDELGVYVRTKQGGWFGIGDWWNSAALDVTGKLWEYLVANIENFDYTEERRNN